MSIPASGTVLACALALLLSALPAMARGETPASPGPEDDTIKFEVIEQIPAKDLWHSMIPVFITSKGSGTIGFWQSDEESFPVADGWMSPGFLLAGRGDIEEKPVAVQIWTRASDRFLKEQSLSESKGGQNTVALFGSADGDVRLKLMVAPTGEVTVDGQLVGKVE